MRIDRWWEQRRRRKRQQQARKKKSDNCSECGECSCDVFDCFTLLTFTVLLQAALGMFRASAVDPHTARPGSPGARLASRAVRSYQLNVSARRTAPVCNLSPSCSRYGLQAISAHGLLGGGVRVVRRLRACRAAARAC
ncbi:membrane protein insertion efficiency factor YidD [Nocardioides zeae]